MPIAGGDRGPFVGLLLSQDGLAGAAVTDPPAVGGAAVAVAIDALDGKAPVESGGDHHAGGLAGTTRTPGGRH